MGNIRRFSSAAGRLHRLAPPLLGLVLLSLLAPSLASAQP